jgi:hypothetical protein
MSCTFYLPVFSAFVMLLRDCFAAAGAMVDDFCVSTAAVTSHCKITLCLRYVAQFLLLPLLLQQHGGHHRRSSGRMVCAALTAASTS